MSDNVVFLEYGDFSVYWYGVFIASAVFLSALMFSVLRKLQGNSFTHGMAIALACMPSALVTGRIFYCWFAKASFPGGIADCLDLTKGGYAFYGAMAGVLAVIIAYSKYFGQSFLQLIDAAAPSVSLAVAIGRFSGIVSGDDIGFELTGNGAGDLPFAIWSEADNSWILWVGFFEGIFAVAAFVFSGALFFLRYVRKTKGLRTGCCALAFMLVYGYSQTMLESMRNDSLFMVTLGFVRISQIISIVMALAATVIISVSICRSSRPIPAHYAVWGISAVALAIAVYCEFEMNVQVMLQNYIMMGVSLGFMLGASVFLMVSWVQICKSIPEKDAALPATTRRSRLPSKERKPQKPYSFDFGSLNDKNDGFDDDLDDGFDDGFDDDLEEGFDDGFDDDLEEGFDDGFDDDLEDGLDGQFINPFGQKKSSGTLRLKNGDNNSSYLSRPAEGRNQPPRRNASNPTREGQRPEFSRPAEGRNQPPRRNASYPTREGQRPEFSRQAESGGGEERQPGSPRRYSGYIDPLPEMSRPSDKSRRGGNNSGRGTY